MLDAIRAHGIEVIDFESLECVETAEEARILERKLIDELQPPLNRISGGGSIGYERSSESRAKLGERSQGKKYALGHKQSDWAKARHREDGLKRRDEFMEKAQALGSKAISRAVICLDDGRIFPSQKAAAREYGIDHTGINEMIRGKRNRESVGGLRFAYVDVDVNR